MPKWVKDKSPQEKERKISIFDICIDLKELDLRKNLLLDLMEFKDWDLTKQFAVARSKVEHFNLAFTILIIFSILAFLPNWSLQRGRDHFKFHCL